MTGSGNVAATGQGIASEQQAQIFDPGLTTKGVVVATGLAQSISYNIVKRHKGRMHVQRDLGKGTEMAIYIPTNLVEPAADEKENG